jgi:methionyl-tRNA formyltransferase
VTDASVVTDKEQSVPGTIVVEKHRLLVATSDGWLAIQSLKPAGKKEMPIQAFLAGYRTSLRN